MGSIVAIIIIAYAWPMRPRGAFVVSFCHFHKIINELLMTEIKARVEKGKGGRRRGAGKEREAGLAK